MPKHSTKPKKICLFEGCGRKAYARGWCHTHWEQDKAGQPKTAIRWRRPKGTPPAIICDEVPCHKMGTPCHVFRGGKNSGYGQISINRWPKLVHCYIWEKENGPIPDDLMIDHQCRVRACCNTEHLRLVTRQVNNTENIEGANWQLMTAKTHCPNGHPYDDENTYLNPAGSRECLRCRSDRKKAWRLAARQKGIRVT